MSMCCSSASAASRRAFHALQAVLVDRQPDLAGMVGCVLDDVLADLLLTAAEQKIVAREIRVAEHVCGDQDVFGDAVAVGEVRMTRIAGKHHLEEPRVTHAVLHELVDVAHAEGPVRHPDRQAVHRNLHHEGVRHFLEVDRIESQPGLDRELLDARQELTPFAVAHGVVSLGLAGLLLEEVPYGFPDVFDAAHGKTAGGLAFVAERLEKATGLGGELALRSR